MQIKTLQIVKVSKLDVIMGWQNSRNVKYHLLLVKLYNYLRTQFRNALSR